MEGRDNGDTSFDDGLCCFCGDVRGHPGYPEGRDLPTYLHGELRVEMLKMHFDKWGDRLRPGDVQRTCRTCSARLSKFKKPAEIAIRVAQGAPGTSTSEKRPEVVSSFWRASDPTRGSETTPVLRRLTQGRQPSLLPSRAPI